MCTSCPALRKKTTHSIHRPSPHPFFPALATGDFAERGRIDVLVLHRPLVRCPRCFGELLYAVPSSEVQRSRGCHPAASLDTPPRHQHDPPRGPLLAPETGEDSATPTQRQWPPVRIHTFPKVLGKREGTPVPSFLPWKIGSSSPELPFPGWQQYPWTVSPPTIHTLLDHGGGCERWKSDRHFRKNKKL